MKFKWTTVSFHIRGFGSHSSHQCVMLNPPRQPVDVGSFRRDDRGLWDVLIANGRQHYVVSGTWQEMRRLVQDEWTRNFMEQ